MKNPLQCKEFQSYVLNGLDSTYDAIVTTITTRLDPMSLEDLFSHLLNFELCLEQHQFVLEAIIESTNMATRNENSKNHGGKSSYQ